MTKKVIEVTPEQVELARTKVEADVKSGRKSDPLVVLVAQAQGRGGSVLRAHRKKG